MLKSNSLVVVLGGIPRILYTAKFSSNVFKVLTSSYYVNIGALCYEGNQTLHLRLCVDGLDVITRPAYQ